LTKDLAEGLNLGVDSGILVMSVLPGSPAEKAGLQKNDVIVEFDKNSVRDEGRFRLMVANTDVGKSVPIALIRDGKRKQISITLAERPSEQVVAAAPASADRWLGLEVEDAESGDANGVVVVDVAEASPAWSAGIREGDVITEIYSQRIESVRDYAEVSKRLKDRKEPIAFLVKRNQTSRYFPVIPDKK
ncbi:MAG: degP 1, partial [Candidatus Krumholzibacteriota bacterium]|nr:degP 1 [Candidatus Krumholzibacteriota bacterium]